MWRDGAGFGAGNNGKESPWGLSPIPDCTLQHTGLVRGGGLGVRVLQLPLIVTVRGGGNIYYVFSG